MPPPKFLPKKMNELEKAKFKGGRPKGRQNGSIELKGKSWHFRFREQSRAGKVIKRSLPLGSLKDLPTKADAQEAAQYFRVHQPRNLVQLIKAKHFGRTEAPLNLAWFNAKFLEQKGRCAICESMPKRLVIDHDHNDGEFRGLLCATCNSGLGMFRDSIRHLLAAVAYLEQYEAACGRNIG